MEVLRTIIALLAILLAPGYLLLRALYPTGGPRDAERIALILGCSLAITVIVGLVLQLTHGGLTTTSEAWGIGGVLLVLTLAAATRSLAARRHQPSHPLRSSASLLARRALPWILFGALGVGAYAIAHRGASAVARRSAFTQLWLIPRDGTLQVGVSSFEHHTAQFHVSVTAGPLSLAHFKFTLNPGATYTRQLTVSPNIIAARRLDVRLFLGHGSTPYRRVSWSPTDASAP
jgi:uncharacterized membrane protein